MSNQSFCELNVVTNGSRKEYLDIARGICMVCIILGHLGDPYLNRFVFTFHLPVFFLISGFYFNPNNNFRSFLKKRIRSLIVPYFVCSFLTALSYCAVQIIVLKAAYENIIDGLKDLGIAILYAAGDPWKTPFVIPGMGAIWFLWAMFWGQLILLLLMKTKPAIRVITLVLLFVFAHKTVVDIVFLPLSIQPGCTAALYIFVGYVFRDYERVLSKLSVETKILGGVSAVWVWFGFVRDFQSFWLVHSDYGRGIVDLIGSLCASGVIIFISYLLFSQKFRYLNRYLSYIGKNSLIFLCAHFIELRTFPWWQIVNSILKDSYSDIKAIYLKIVLKILWASVCTYGFIALKNIVVKKGHTNG